MSSEEPREEPNEQPEKPAARSTQPEVEADKDRKLAELTDDLKRLQADFENYKKRTERDWSERSRFAAQKLIANLLPILDSFDKAIEETRKAGDDECLTEGMAKVHRQLVQTLEREGLKQIRTDGKFDPFLHEAIQREEGPDADEGKILEVYQKGYALNGKVLRPARVKVARRTEQRCEPESKSEAVAIRRGEDDDQYAIK